MKRSDYSNKHLARSDAIEEILIYVNRGWKADKNYLQKIKAKYDINQHTIDSAMSVINR